MSCHRTRVSDNKVSIPGIIMHFTCSQHATHKRTTLHTRTATKGKHKLSLVSRPSKVASRHLRISRHYSSGMDKARHAAVGCGSNAGLLRRPLHEGVQLERCELLLQAQRGQTPPLVPTMADPSLLLHGQAVLFAVHRTPLLLADAGTDARRLYA